MSPQPLSQGSQQNQPSQLFSCCFSRKPPESQHHNQHREVSKREPELELPIAEAHRPVPEIEFRPDHVDPFDGSGGGPEEPLRRWNKWINMKPSLRWIFLDKTPWPDQDSRSTKPKVLLRRSLYKKIEFFFLSIYYKILLKIFYNKN